MLERPAKKCLRLHKIPNFILKLLSLAIFKTEMISIEYLRHFSGYEYDTIKTLINGLSLCGSCSISLSTHPW